MRNNPRRFVLAVVIIPLLALILVSTTLISSANTGQAIAKGGESSRPMVGGQNTAVGSKPTENITITLYMPIVTAPELPPAMESLSFYTLDKDGKKQQVFLTSEMLFYHSQGTNNLADPIQVDLQITQSGPGSPGTIFNDTLFFEPGPWSYDLPSSMLVYTGVYTTTARFIYGPNKITTTTLTTHHDVITPLPQGFDKCYIPTVEEMNTWWDESPYSVFNLYLGGISFYCDNQPLDAEWVQKVASQGWSFIPTWVGPQAPCSGYDHLMSANPAIAYGQGREEAQAALSAAQNLGFPGDQVIYYDLEGYSGNSSCRATVKEFLRGWNEQLHELNLKAGIYGSPCRSYIADWAEITPPPDDVWIAKWNPPPYFYDPRVTIWGEICDLTDNMWSNHQRIKQYTGGHSETWGGVSLTIDSNVVDGDIATVPLSDTSTTHITSDKTVVISQYGTPLDDMGLPGPGQGWVQAEGRLIFTADGAQTWRDATPYDFSVMAADFPTPNVGWAVVQDTPRSDLAIAHTKDGGSTWDIQLLPDTSSADHPPAASAYIGLLGEGSAYVALKLQSGSSFSLGRLFVTADDGRTWEERQLPIGEPVLFLDAERGWTAGGPAGDLLYYTQDGGSSWQLQALDLPAGGRITIGLPRFSDQNHGLLPVAKSDPSGTQLLEFRTEDGGRSWGLGTDEISAARLDKNGASPELITSADYQPPSNQINLPANAIAVDFLDDQHGWVLTQIGSCQGDKTDQDGEEASSKTLQCQETWKLLATEDGGLSWSEVSIP